MCQDIFHFIELWDSAESAFLSYEKMIRETSPYILAACLLSAGIEFLQLILKLGFSEFDDVIDNTAGE